MSSDEFRSVEVYDDGEWHSIEFQDIKEGDIVRIYETDRELVGEYEALSDAYINLDFDVFEIAVKEV